MTDHLEMRPEPTPAPTPGSAAVLSASDRQGSPAEPAPRPSATVTLEEQMIAPAQGPSQIASESVPLLTDFPGPAFVYALGQIEPRFPTLAVEKEFAQVVG